MKQVYLILALCISSLGYAAARQRSAKKEEAGANREGKLFSLFTVVNFKNDACVSSSTLSSGSTTYRNGTCFTLSECSSKGGSSKGNCASGFGVCCVFTYSTTSQTTVNYNDTYLQNPGFPSTYGDTGTLSYTINKCSSDVCWLRLDFETFQTEGPADTDETPSGGACTDMLTLTVSTGQQIPTLCGQLTGQHIYVDIGTGSSDTATLALAFTGTSTQRKWDVKVAQIPCFANYAPPDGCLQWQTGLTGTIRTFNQEDATSTHLQSQDYSHCIRQEAGMCCVEYTVCSDAQADFSLDGQNLDTAKALIGTSCGTAIDATAALNTADYINIEASGGTCGEVSVSTYCGGKLCALKDSTVNCPVCDCTAPFSVGIKTDAFPEAKSAANGPNQGICLNYRQVACTGTV